MFVSVMISGLIVRCCAVPTSDDVQLRLEGVRGDVPSKLVASGQEIPIYTGLYTAIQHYTLAIHRYTFLYFGDIAGTSLAAKSLLLCRIWVSSFFACRLRRGQTYDGKR